jgi:ankyrin repeat protein
LLRDDPTLIESGGALHLMAKRNDLQAVAWLLRQGANPNARWAHWDAEVTPLHLAASRGHGEVVRLLLASGADVRIRDSKHHGTPLDWARHFGQPATLEILEGPAR